MPLLYISLWLTLKKIWLQNYKNYTACPEMSRFFEEKKGLWKACTTAFFWKYLSNMVLSHSFDKVAWRHIHCLQWWYDVHTVSVMLTWDQLCSMMMNCLPPDYFLCLMFLNTESKMNFEFEITVFGQMTEFSLTCNTCFFYKRDNRIIIVFIYMFIYIIFISILIFPTYLLINPLNQISV